MGSLVLLPAVGKWRWEAGAARGSGAAPGGGPALDAWRLQTIDPRSLSTDYYYYSGTPLLRCRTGGDYGRPAQSPEL